MRGLGTKGGLTVMGTTSVPMKDLRVSVDGRDVTARVTEATAGMPADSGIGTAASHGCLRMHMPDVENLSQYVVVGMPVEIRN